MKAIQQELRMDYGITREQACILCHLSSECSECCLKCTKSNGCQGQNCSQPFRDHEGQRWDTWMYLVATALPELKRFVPIKFSKHLKK